MSVLYEKGSAAWDLGQIHTRHGDGYRRNQNGEVRVCARVAELRRTALMSMDAGHRLDLALLIECSCGAGDSSAEQTSRKPTTTQGDSDAQEGAGTLRSS